MTAHHLAKRTHPWFTMLTLSEHWVRMEFAWSSHGVHIEFTSVCNVSALFLYPKPHWHHHCKSVHQVLSQCRGTKSRTAPERWRFPGAKDRQIHRPCLRSKVSWKYLSILSYKVRHLAKWACKVGAHNAPPHHRIKVKVLAHASQGLREHSLH